jgi:hypothetical protein
MKFLFFKAKKESEKKKAAKFFKYNWIFGTMSVFVIAMFVFLAAYFSLGQLVPSGAASSAITSGNKENNAISLVINLGDETTSDVKEIQSVLDLLKTKEIKLTFAVTGKFAAINSKIIKQIVTDGHELANAGFFSNSFDKLTEKQASTELTNTHKLIKTITGTDAIGTGGHEMKLFLPSSGKFNGESFNAAKKLGYAAITVLQKVEDLTNFKVGDFVKITNLKTFENDIENIFKNNTKK